MTFIEHGADVNVGAGVWTPLYCAADRGNTECVTALLQHGADINSRDWKGETPLHKAAEHGHVDCFKKLVQSGADTTLRNKINKTALNFAHESTKQQMQHIVETFQTQKSHSRKHGENIKQEHTNKMRPLLVSLHSDDEDSSKSRAREGSSK